jgi:hypothetical protein
VAIDLRCCLVVVAFASLMNAAFAEDLTKMPPPAYGVGALTFSIESASLKKSKVAVDGKVWKVDADEIDAEGNRRFNIEHRERGAALYLNITEAERGTQFDTAGFLRAWFDPKSNSKAKTIAIPPALKIDAAWRCSARHVSFPQAIEKHLVLCTQQRGPTTLEFMLGVPIAGWERDAAAVNEAMASLVWVSNR